ncbi:MAG: SCO family protein [Ilumatobacter sp.]
MLREIGRRSGAAVLVACSLVLAACGSSDGASSSSADVLSGVVREPAPVVDSTPLPSLTEPGSDVVFRADPGEVQVVYFGFTNCPDVCPTTLADFTVALRKLEAETPGLSERVETVMVTIDPARDNAVLPQYVTSFVSNAIAAGTDDEATLLAAAEPFGASYEVRTLDDGTIEVDHSPFLYAVDDEGQLALSWQFGASSDDMASDLEILLERASA